MPVCDTDQNSLSGKASLLGGILLNNSVLAMANSVTPSVCQDGTVMYTAPAPTTTVATMAPAVPASAIKHSAPAADTVLATVMEHIAPALATYAARTQDRVQCTGASRVRHASRLQLTVRPSPLSRTLRQHQHCAPRDRVRRHGAIGVHRSSACSLHHARPLPVVDAGAAIHSKVPVETCCIISGVKLRVMCIEVSNSREL